jgi:hypothetical protein
MSNKQSIVQEPDGSNASFIIWIEKVFIGKKKFWDQF